MNGLLGLLNELELPEKYKRYYDFRVISLFEWFEQDFWLLSDKETVKENLKLWEAIIKNDIIEYDLEIVLRLQWYDIFWELTYDEFNKSIDNGSIKLEDLSRWKILIWYIEDFSRVILVSKYYSISDSVCILIN